MNSNLMYKSVTSKCHFTRERMNVFKLIFYAPKRQNNFTASLRQTTSPQIIITVICNRNFVCNETFEMYTWRIIIVNRRAIWF